MLRNWFCCLRIRRKDRWYLARKEGEKVGRRREGGRREKEKVKKKKKRKDKGDLHRWALKNGQTRNGSGCFQKNEHMS